MTESTRYPRTLKRWLYWQFVQVLCCSSVAPVALLALCNQAIVRLLFHLASTCASVVVVGWFLVVDVGSKAEKKGEMLKMASTRLE